jgi:hypothetical protein
VTPATVLGCSTALVTGNLGMRSCPTKIVSRSNVEPSMSTAGLKKVTKSLVYTVSGADARPYLSWWLPYVCTEKERVSSSSASCWSSAEESMLYLRGSPPCPPVHASFADDGEVVHFERKELNVCRWG